MFGLGYSASWRVGLPDGDCDHEIISADTLDELNQELEWHRGKVGGPERPNSSLKIEGPYYHA